MKKSFMLAAFTLAEVLITLAIIGVVAALTIPTVITNQSKQQYYTRFMKSYNVLTTAFQLAQAQHGSIGTWSFGNTLNASSSQTFFDTYLRDKLKVAKYCNTASDCGISSNLKWKQLNCKGGGCEYSYENKLFGDGEYPVILLQDGTLINFVMSPYVSTSDIYVDTNGAAGPNTKGRDMFDFKLYNTPQKGYILAPKGTYEPIPGQIDLYQLISKESMQQKIQNGCSETSSNGDSCGMRLLLERKMNY